MVTIEILIALLVVLVAMLVFNAQTIYSRTMEWLIYHRCHCLLKIYDTEKVHLICEVIKNGRNDVLEKIIASKQPEMKSNIEIMGVFVAAAYNNVEAMAMINAAYSYRSSVFQPCDTAAQHGCKEALEWAVLKGGYGVNKDIMRTAAWRGHLGMVQWLRAAANCPWDNTACIAAAEAGHVDVLVWLLDNGCPCEHGDYLLMVKNARSYAIALDRELDYIVHEDVMSALEYNEMIAEYRVFPKKMCATCVVQESKVVTGKETCNECLVETRQALMDIDVGLYKDITSVISGYLK